MTMLLVFLKERSNFAVIPSKGLPKKEIIVSVQAVIRRVNTIHGHKALEDVLRILRTLKSPIRNISSGNRKSLNNSRDNNTKSYIFRSHQCFWAYR